MTASPSPLLSNPPEAAQVLEPCPFCGSREIFLTSKSNGLWSFGYCGPCGAQGPVEEGKPVEDSATKRWNRRPVPPAADQVGEVEKREAVAKIVARAVNIALAGVQAPGRLDSKNDGALYFADEILAALAPQVGAGDREAQNPICSADGCHRRSPCGIGCRDNGNFK